MRYSKIKKKNKYELRADHRERLTRSLIGDGLYLYQNRSEIADLQLPKPNSKGNRYVGPKEQFLGDSYFKQMIKSNELILVEVVTPGVDEMPIPIQEVAVEEKLILDQPDQVTDQGKVEHVVRKSPTPTKPANESSQNPGNREVLLVEDPMAGVTIRE